jgi:hypothetical protein
MKILYDAQGIEISSGRRRQLLRISMQQRGKGLRGSRRSAVRDPAEKRNNKLYEMLMTPKKTNSTAFFGSIAEADDLR